MSATIGHPDAQQPSQPTRAFGPVESADESRQAQHTNANDTPTDVNANAALCRIQTGTYALQAANFEAGASRRNGILDLLLGQLGLQVQKPA